MIDTFDAIAERAGSTLHLLAAVLLIAVALLIAADVTLRGVFNRPIIGVAEIVANGVVIIAFLQLSYTVRIGAMLRSELLVSRLGPGPRAVLDAVVSILGVLFFALIAWSSYEPMMRAIATNEFEGYASFRVPVWPVRVVIVACSLLAILNYLLIAYKALARGEAAPAAGET